MLATVIVFATIYIVLGIILEGHSNPLQYSCLENHRDKETLWAAVCGVAQSWTLLKRLSSSSSRYYINNRSFKVYGRMCLGYMQILHHFIEET